MPQRTQRAPARSSGEFWGEKSSWHYDLMLVVVMNLVIIFTDGGRWVLLK
jgi:hypothetical protein